MKHPPEKPFQDLLKIRRSSELWTARSGEQAGSAQCTAFISRRARRLGVRHAPRNVAWSPCCQNLRLLVPSRPKQRPRQAASNIEVDRRLFVTSSHVLEARSSCRQADSCCFRPLSEETCEPQTMLSKAPSLSQPGRHAASASHEAPSDRVISMLHSRMKSLHQYAKACSA